MTNYLKASAVLLGLGLLVGITYWWAAFSTSFKMNICYSDVLSFVSEQAHIVATEKDEDATAAFKAMLQSLPLHGYETECGEVLNAIEQYKNGHSQR
jgi:hypothetical protein